MKCSLCDGEKIVETPNGKRHTCPKCEGMGIVSCDCGWRGDVPIKLIEQPECPRCRNVLQLPAGVEVVKLSPLQVAETEEFFRNNRAAIDATNELPDFDEDQLQMLIDSVCSIDHWSKLGTLPADASQKVQMATSAFFLVARELQKLMEESR